jgi:hypothetical protein
LNCAPEDVRLIIDTSLSDDELTRLIVLADERITNRGIELNKKYLSMLFTAAGASLQDAKSRGVGTFSNLPSIPEAWLKIAEQVIAESKAAAPGTVSGGGVVLMSWNDPLPGEEY